MGDATSSATKGMGETLPPRGGRNRETVRCRETDSLAAEPQPPSESGAGWQCVDQWKLP